MRTTATSKMRGPYRGLLLGAGLLLPLLAGATADVGLKPPHSSLPRRSSWWQSPWHPLSRRDSAEQTSGAQLRSVQGGSTTLSLRPQSSSSSLFVLKSRETEGLERRFGEETQKEIQALSEPQRLQLQKLYQLVYGFGVSHARQQAADQVRMSSSRPFQKCLVRCEPPSVRGSHPVFTPCAITAGGVWGPGGDAPDLSASKALRRGTRFQIPRPYHPMEVRRSIQ